MKDQLVPYEPSQLMKELGFDEPCLYAYCEQGGWNKYTGKREEITIVLKTDGNPWGLFFAGKNWNKTIEGANKNKIQCSAPLWQQAIDWLREKYRLAICIEPWKDMTGHSGYDCKIFSHSRYIGRTSHPDFAHCREAGVQEALEILKNPKA